MNEPKLRFPEFTGEWEEKKLGEVASSFSGGTPKSSESKYYGGDIPFIRSGEIHGCKTELYITEEGLNKSSAKLVSKGDLLIALYGATSGEVAISKIDGAINQAILCVRSQSINSNYLCNYLEYKKDTITSKFLQGGQGNLSSDIIMSLNIPSPSPAEQQKIASCLSAMDDLIAAQAEKVEALKEKKTGLMQQMFPQAGETTPRLRFPEFTGEWEVKKLGEVFTRLTEKNTEDNKNVLTISAQYGLISQLDFFKKSVAASDVTGYYLLHKGDFAYNKSSSLGKPVGAIKPLKLYDKGVVSTLYICFRCNNPREIGFWEQYFDAGILDKEIMSIAQEGARNHGLLNVPTTGFFELNIITPPSPTEQEKIASCLSALDDQIAAETEKLTALKDYKKGLMQQLFPQPAK